MPYNYPVLISGCLLGIPCRYDGRGSGCSGIIRIASSINFIPFCPEQLGGLPTPRPPANIVGGDGRDVLSGDAKVINSHGEDVTDAFSRGANESLKLARLMGAEIALLKDKSPSCGLFTPYCDMLNERGIGVTAALFNSSGIRTLEIGRSDDFPSQQFIALIEELYGRSPL
jgi:uncharacterized protein YbbK (DUF523 family)